MYLADEKRYDTMRYNRCGASGLKLPAVSLGLWHNFGSNGDFDNMEAMCHTAFDHGITHFDLANNYGPAAGAAEENFGRILKNGLGAYRDELVISTKAGYGMWQGPYGDGGSKKYLVASLDQSLKRMGLEYVDIFYHHRPDPETPLEETMEALSDMVRQGKALYVGISKYSAEQTKKAAEILARNHTPLLIHQFRYNMLDRRYETEGLKDTLKELGVGSISFSPLAQGILTDRYLHGIPEGSRAARNHFLKEKDIGATLVEKVERLNHLAGERGQTLAEMALCWNLRGDHLNTVLIGASRPEQIENNVKILNGTDFSEEELKRIEEILAE